MNSEDLPMNTSAHQGLQPGDAAILEDSPDVLLLTSCGTLDSDISNTRKVRIAVPDVRIVMFGGAQGRRGQPAEDRTLPYSGISVVGCTSAVARCLLPK